MSPVGDITIYESQLFRAYSAPTAADRIRNPGYRPTYSYGLVCCLIDFQLNNAECFFIDKATERGDAVASLSEVNAVRWENRQVI